MPKLEPPHNAVAVRMYRIGHGDCFLLAMPRAGGGDPVYIMIDCGYKPGSPGFIPGDGSTIGEIVADIGEATGYHLDLVIITHEHQDHLNGIWKQNDPYFGNFKIDEAWMAWTEDGDDPLANELRRKHRDQLLGLLEARRKLAMALGADSATVTRLDSLLSLEYGGEGDDATSVSALRLALDDPEKSVNKQALKLVKDKANQNRGVFYLSPGGKPRFIPGTDGIRTFVLGPPRSTALLADEDPVGEEGFPLASSHGVGFQAAAISTEGRGSAPFRSRYCIPIERGLKDADSFFREHYGNGEEGKDDSDKVEVSPNTPWRRIDSEWLFSAEELALKLNTGINNTSLVLAIELPQSKKIMLFAGDAQRGNWISWSDVEWDQSDESISTRDLLARTVLYKCGHHGSHNATLNGKLEDDYANLSWMATGAAAAEFTAMITAVNEWAMTKNNPPWRHPLPSIKKALLKKASGRVFQTDEAEPTKPRNVSDSSWEKFLASSQFEQQYFDYVVRDQES